MEVDALGAANSREFECNFGAFVEGRWVEARARGGGRVSDDNRKSSFPPG